jgi:hypothetical protein
VLVVEQCLSSQSSICDAPDDSGHRWSDVDSETYISFAGQRVSSQDAEEHLGERRESIDTPPLAGLS